MFSSDELLTSGDGLLATATNEETGTITATNEEVAAIVDPTSTANSNALSNTPTIVDPTSTILKNLGLTWCPDRPYDEQLRRLT